MPSSMEGRRAVSLYAGITTVKSTVAGSASDGRGRGVVGDAWERYSFSEGWVIIGGGESRTRTA